jgi:guanylate kinase
MPNDPSSGPVHTRRGMMLVVVSPSGAGKTSLSRRLMAQDDAIRFSVSWTTRPARVGEEDGVHYVFVSKDAFRTERGASGFLEWAEVHDHYYGSPRGPVMATLESGNDLLFDIDWQGAQQLKEAAPNDVVKVFILPPSMTELRRRLVGRNTDTPEVIAKRMTNAYGEISRWSSYDYVLLNDDFDATFAKLKSIVAAERLRRARQPWLAGFVEGLLNEDT